MNSKTNGKTFQIFSEGGKIKQFSRACENFATSNPPCENFGRLAKISQTSFACEIRCEIWKACANSFRKPTLPCENIAKFEGGCKLNSQLRNPFHNLANSNNLCAKGQRSVGKPKVAWTNYLKTSHCPICLYSFHKPIYSLQSPTPPCKLVFSPFHVPTATHLKKWPSPLTPFQPWSASEQAILTL